MTFKIFNIADGLSQTPEAYKLYDSENPPFNISCLSKVALDEFKQVASRYDKFFKTGIESAKDVSRDEVIIDICPKIQVVSLEKLAFEEGKISRWHTKVVKILSQEASWRKYYDKSNKDSKIEELKNEFFEHIPYAAFTIEALCEQFKLLKLMTRYHKNCLSQLIGVRTRRWTHSKDSLMGYRVPHFFCTNFGMKLENYLTTLSTSIDLEKQKLATMMLSKFMVAIMSKDLKNGDLLFFLAKGIEGLCKGIFLIDVDKAKNKSIAIENLRAQLEQDRTKNPGAHAILDWQLIPNAPQRSLNYKAYKIFWKLIVSLPETDVSKSIKNKFTNLRWFAESSGIKVETIKYSEGFILVPKVDNESEIISNNAKALKIPFIPHPGAVIEMNEGLHNLELLMRTCYSISPTSLERYTARSISQKTKTSFQVWLKGQKVEDINKLADAINLSFQGILYLCELLKKYNSLVPKKSIVEKQLYNLWDSELKKCLLKLNKYCDVFIFLFKESISISQIIYLAPIMRAIKQYADRLVNVSFSSDKEKIESQFVTLHQEKTDAHFFSLFIDNLRNPREGFIARKKDAPELYTYDTEDSRRLIDLLAVMSSDPGMIMLVGDVWRGASSSNLSTVKRAFKLFQEKVPSQSVDELLYLLLKSLLRTLESKDSPGFNLLTEYHQEELVKTANRDTLLTQWRVDRNNHHTRSVCKEIEGLIKQHEDESMRIRGSYDENPMFFEFTRLANLLPSVLELEESQKIFLIHALNRFIDKKTEIDHWNILPIVLKMEDLNTARKYLRKRLIPLLRDAFLVGLANPSELSCFSKLFEKFPNLKKEIQKDILSKVSDLLNNLRSTSLKDLENVYRKKFTESGFNLEGIAKIAAVFFDDKDQETVGRDLDNLFFSQVKTCITNPSYLEFLLTNNKGFPLQKSFKGQLALFIDEFDEAEWNSQQGLFLYLLKDKFEIDDLRHKYYIKGLELALKNMFIAGEFLDFYKEVGFKAGLRAIYGPYSSEALRILRSSFDDQDFTEVNMELIKVHIEDMTFALNDADADNEDRKRYEAIRTKSKIVKDLKVSFYSIISQLIQYEIMSRDSLMELSLALDATIKFVGSMICAFYAKIHKKLEQIGNSLTESKDTSYNKRVIDITYKNLELLLDFINDLLFKQIITIDQANACTQPIKVWIECLPSLKKITYQ